jgi:N-acyl-phosphatidylethanolamine-hydrolysing phospholipase D
MHWGTFRLTDEPMGEPPILLAKALGERSLPSEVFEVLRVGDQRHVMPFEKIF